MCCAENFVQKTKSCILVTQRSMQTIRWWLVIFVVVLLGVAPVRAKTEAPSDLDNYAARVLKEFEVPGLAVAIVKDGKVVLAKGYGVRKLGDAAPVDERTLFGLGSNTKAFTAASLAILVDEGKVSWDDPVTKHLPAFQFVRSVRYSRDHHSWRSCPTPRRSFAR